MTFFAFGVMLTMYILMLTYNKIIYIKGEFMFIAQVVIIGILLVFLILLLLTLILTAFPRIVNGNKSEKTKKFPEIKQNTEEKETPSSAMTNVNTDDHTLVSVITAAIAAYRAGCGESSDLSSFKVVAFRKTKLGRKS